MTQSFKITIIKDYFTTLIERTRHVTNEVNLHSTIIRLQILY